MLELATRGSFRHSRSDRFLRLLSQFDSVAIVTHNNPDPDAIGSGWGLHELISRKLALPVRCVAGGAILRAENRMMVQLLRPPLVLIDRFAPRSEREAVVLVDCTPTSTNHILRDAAPRPVAVIDHHVVSGRRSRVRYSDVRHGLAATASIITCYLREQQVEPPNSLATALTYAIRSELSGGPVVLTGTDQRAIAWLSHRADHQKIAAIANAPVSRAYFADLLLAIEHTFTYGGTAICFLPRVSAPETVGEFADLLVRGSDINSVLCCAKIDTELMISARSRTGDAAQLLQDTMGDWGTSGGHPHRAGGMIILGDVSAKTLEEIQQTLRDRWLAECNVTQKRGTRLVSRRDILEPLLA